MKRIIYVIESVNFLGGAHVASANLIRELRSRGCCIDVLTDCEPTEETRTRFGAPVFHIWKLPMRNLAWFVRGLYKKILRAYFYPDWTIDPSGRIRRLLRRYDCVCVMSEMDPLRRLVSNLPDSICKVQLIHNDYVAWSTASEFAQLKTKFDECIYRHMTRIAVVGDYNARSFARRFPSLASKTSAFYNVIFLSDCSQIPSARESDGKVRIVTVSRADEVQKASARSVRIAMRLVREGYELDWTFIGSGYENLSRFVAEAGMSDRIHFLGVVVNPGGVLPCYDLMALFSHYEGVPMVVYEAFAAGLPVVATAVSGLPDQITHGVNGWLFENEEESIYRGLCELLQDVDKIRVARQNLIGYTYDNNGVIMEHEKLLGC